MALLPSNLRPIAGPERVQQQLNMAAALRGSGPPPPGPLAAQAPGGAPPPPAAPYTSVGHVNPAPVAAKPPMDIEAIRAQAKAEAHLELMHRLHQSGALKSPSEMKAASKPAPAASQPRGESPVANRPNPDFSNSQRRGHSNGRGGRVQPMDLTKDQKKGK